jgi:hypothetical protein
MVLRFACLLALLLAPTWGWAQQLLWQQFYTPPGSVLNYLMYCSLTPQGEILVAGASRPPTATCQVPGYRQVFLRYAMSGTLLREQLGRGSLSSIQGFRQGTGSRYWWAGDQPICPSTPWTSGSLVQRVTARGDTLLAWPLLAPVPPEHHAIAVLEDGRRLLVAGLEATNGPNQQRARCTLTSVDTASGQVRWRYAYDRLPLALDYAVDLVRTPRGGYLLSGDGIVPTSVYYQHLFLETDSLGHQLKQRLLYPLGPNYNGGSRLNGLSNLVALPNAQGYLASGTADSMPNSNDHYRRAYVLRLDTALHVTWVYAHPPALDGQLSQEANRLRLLPDGSVALLLRDIPLRNASGSVRSTGLRLLQLDLTTGELLSRYALPTPSQRGLRLFDWQWVGDGTLILCGQSGAMVGGGVSSGYLARWDFRQTPLATGRPATVAGGASLRLYPTPGTSAQPTTAHYQLPPSTGGGQLVVTDVLGRVLQHHALPTAGRTGTLPLAGLPAGLYLVRLLPPHGPALTQRLLVQP